MEDAQNHLPRLLSTDGCSQSLTTQFDDDVQPLSIELLAEKRAFADEGGANGDAVGIESEDGDEVVHEGAVFYDGQGDGPALQFIYTIQVAAFKSQACAGESFTLLCNDNIDAWARTIVRFRQ